MNRTLYLLCGKKESGKERISNAMLHSMSNAAAISTDNYFMDEKGKYTFKPSELKQAQEACYNNVEHLTARNRKNIIVTDSNITAKQEKLIRDLAHDNSYVVVKLQAGK